MNTTLDTSLGWALRQLLVSFDIRHKQLSQTSIAGGKLYPHYIISGYIQPANSKLFRADDFLIEDVLKTMLSGIVSTQGVAPIIEGSDIDEFIVTNVLELLGYGVTEMLALVALGAMSHRTTDYIPSSSNIFRTFFLEGLKLHLRKEVTFSCIEEQRLERKKTEKKREKTRIAIYYKSLQQSSTCAVS